ncbi:MAG: hypothetical protein ACI8Y4_001311 [Candidatus Poriferisodalaceae bacterium]|jgi:hypothetical protein
MQILLFSAGGNDVGARVEFARCQGHQYSGGVPVRGDHDRLCAVDRSLHQHVVPCGVTLNRNKSGFGCSTDRLSGAVDHNDVVGVNSAVDQLVRSGLARGSEATDHVMVVHASPPSSSEKVGSRLFGQHFDCGADNEDEEQDARRGDQQDRGQPGPSADGRNVAVASRSHGHRRVVQGVEHADRVAGDVAVAPVAPDGHDEGGDRPTRRATAVSGGRLRRGV